MLNKVQLIGRLGKDPELRYTQAGVGVCNFSLATTERWTGQDGQPQEKTEWHNITVWNHGQSKLAESCAQYLAKGKQAYVEGSLETRSWDDQQSGEKKYATGIKANKVLFLTPRDDNAPAQQRAPQQQRAPAQQQARRPQQQQARHAPAQQLDSMEFPEFEPPASQQKIDVNDYENIPF